MAQKEITTMRLSAEALRLLDSVSARYGISRTAIIELAIRDIAARACAPLALLPQEHQRSEPVTAP